MNGRRRELDGSRDVDQNWRSEVAGSTSLKGRVGTARQQVSSQAKSKATYRVERQRCPRRDMVKAILDRLPSGVTDGDRLIEGGELGVIQSKFGREDADIREDGSLDVEEAGSVTTIFYQYSDDSIKEDSRRQTLDE